MRTPPVRSRHAQQCIVRARRDLSNQIAEACVSEQPRSAPLPPHRKWWVECMCRGARRSHLIAEELERLACSRERGEAAAVRGFLVAWRRATQGDNPIGLELKVKRAKANLAIVFAHSHVGSVRWLPVLVVPWTHRFERIGRECGDLERFPYTQEPARDVWGEVEQKRRPLVPKTEIRLIRPSRQTATSHE